MENIKSKFYNNARHEIKFLDKISKIVVNDNCFLKKFLLNLF